MYDQIARYYDLIHADLTADIDYILTLAGENGGPVLELGCGSGRLLLPLAGAGFAVTGLDNSPVMLARARSRLSAESESVQERVTLVEADMTAFELDGEDGRFALAIIPYNTLMHLEPAQMLKTFRRIGRYLHPNGQLFIDNVNPAAIAQTANDRTLTLENRLDDPETGDIILQMASNWLDDVAQLLHITWIYDASPAAGGPVQRTVAQAQYHYLYPHQLELLLEEAGFKLESIGGNYDGSPFTEESERLLILAVKMVHNSVDTVWRLGD